MSSDNKYAISVVVVFFFFQPAAKMKADAIG